MGLLRSLGVVFDNCHDAVIVTDGGELGLLGDRIVYVNRAFSRETGYAREEVVSHPLISFLTEAIHSEILKTSLESAAQPLHLDLRIRCKGRGDASTPVAAWRIHDPEKRKEYIAFQ